MHHNKGKMSKQQRQLENKRKKVKASYDLTRRVNEKGEIELVLVPQLLPGQKQQDIMQEEIVLGPSYIKEQEDDQFSDEQNNDIVYDQEDEEQMMPGDDWNDIEAQMLQELLKDECKAGIDEIKVEKAETQKQLIKETNFAVDNDLEAQLEEEFKLFMAEGGADAYVKQFSSQNKQNKSQQQKQLKISEEQQSSVYNYSYEYDSEMELEELQIDEDVDEEFGFNDYLNGLETQQDIKMTEAAENFLEQQLFGNNKNKTYQNVNFKPGNQQQALSNIESIKSQNEIDEEKAANDFFTSQITPNNPENIKVTDADMRLLQQINKAFNSKNYNLEEDDEMIPEQKNGNFDSHSTDESVISEFQGEEDEIPQFKSRQYKDYDILDKKFDMETGAELLENQATAEDIAWQLEQLRLMEKQQQEVKDSDTFYAQNLQIHNQSNYQAQHPNPRQSDQEITKHVPLQIGYTGVPLGVFTSKKQKKQEESDQDTPDENVYQKITFSHEKKRGLTEDQRKLRKQVIQEAKKQKREQKRQLKQEFEQERVRLQKARFREQSNIQGRQE